MGIRDGSFSHFSRIEKWEKEPSLIPIFCFSKKWEKEPSLIPIFCFSKKWEKEPSLIPSYPPLLLDHIVL